MSQLSGIITAYHAGLNEATFDGLMEIKEDYDALVRSGGIVELGLLPNEIFLSELQGSKFMILPSRVEGMPRVVLEAFRYGVIPILSHIPEHKSFENLGFKLLWLGDELADSIVELDRDIAKFAEFIETNYELAHKLFNIENTNEKIYAELYEIGSVFT